MAWSLHQQTAPRQTTASHSQPNPEEMEKYSWYCLQRKQDHTSTTTANKDILARQSTDDHHRHQLQNVPHCYRINNTSACSKIAQTLYTARHDRMLRPIYHCLLDNNDFQESDHGKPWYQQSLTRAVLERRISWTTEKWLKINYEHWQGTELSNRTLPEMDFGPECKYRQEVLRNCLSGKRNLIDIIN